MKEDAHTEKEADEEMRKMKVGLKVKSRGLTREGKRLLLDTIHKCLWLIQHRRKEEHREHLPYWIQLR